jgi:hypothetical protein
MLYKNFDYQLAVPKYSISFQAKFNFNYVISTIANQSPRTYFNTVLSPRFWTESASQTTSFPAIQLGTWVHLTFTFDYTNKILGYYRDGAFVGSYSPPTMTQPDTSFIFSIVILFLKKREDIILEIMFVVHQMQL